jgi:putative acetyltransferase
MSGTGDSFTSASKAASKADTELVIRGQNRTSDLNTICTINDAAFAEHGGTKAFDQFRRERHDILSLVAIADGELIAHVLFSPVVIETPEGNVAGMGLGQLAVAPQQQRQGIGRQITEAGISELRNRGCPFIIVIGHASYYPRFGFERGSLHGVKCQWEGVPDDSFMLLFLDQTQRGRLRGVASFDGL